MVLTFSFEDLKNRMLTVFGKFLQHLHMSPVRYNCPEEEEGLEVPLYKISKE
jgi:hypothetical protein